MNTKKRLKHLEESNTKVLFTFGAPGSGKTTFLAALYQSMFDDPNLKISLNTSDNAEGVRYIEKISEDLTDFKFPNITAPGTIKEVDWYVEDKSLHTREREGLFTFIDMAGENLQKVYSGSQQTTSTGMYGTLNNEIIEYLTSDLDLNFILIVDYKRAQKDNKLINAFFNFITKFDNPPNNIAIVVTQWDEKPQHDPEEVEAFVRRTCKNTYLRALDMVENLKCFSCTVGSKDPTNPMRIMPDTFNLSSFNPIVGWLFEISQQPRKSSKKDRFTLSISLDDILSLVKSFK